MLRELGFASSPWRGTASAIFAEVFEEHDLTDNVTYTCDDTFSANRGFELKTVKGTDFRMGLGLAWNREDPTTGRDGIIDFARSLARPGR